MAAAVYADIAKQVLSLFNAQAVTTAYPTSVTDIGTSKRNPSEIKEAVVESDIEARVAICETLGNGYRPGFVALNGALPVLSGSPQSFKLPDHIGPVSNVEILLGSGDWVMGEQCPLSEIREIIRNPDNVFGVAHDAVNSPTGGFYFIDEAGSLITFTGVGVRMYIATLGAIDRITPTLLTPDAYSPFLVARSIARLYKHGDNMEFINYYSRQADQLMLLIRKGEAVLPQLEPIQRAA